MGVHPVCAQVEPLRRGCDALSQSDIGVHKAPALPLGDESPMAIVDVKGILADSEAGMQDHDGAAMNDEVDWSEAPKVLGDIGREVAQNDDEVFAGERCLVLLLESHIIECEKEPEK